MKHHAEFSLDMGCLSLDINQTFDHEFIMISGENGSGKTTFLRCLAGLEKKVQGRWVLNDVVQLDSASSLCVPVHERSVACVWRDAALLPWLNVQQNIELGIRSQDALFFSNLCEALHISHLLARYPAVLSSGEAQRVNIARALCRQAKLVLLDEPFSAQAPAMRQHLRQWFKKSQQEWAIPIIMVSHDLEDVHALADQHWQMQAGRLWQL
ncbi:MAG: ATP-binding cassette domain-containing protein [Mariprofundaceae bacterium]|nr:ATP-binding cassette domain-containing protein [Mariprofundaceae bacterium]